MRLEALQRSMMEALEQGPDFVDYDAFLGPQHAVMRGFSVHANTISHARLVALEETFPRTRQALGDARFNALSREFSETAACSAQPLATIGREFANCLSAHDERELACLARFEWAWLESYHAAEMNALALTELARLPEEGLLATCVALHPAARLAGPVSDAGFAEEFPDVANAPAVLLTRPQSEVLICTASQTMARQFENLISSQSVCNLLALGSEQDAEDGLNSLLAMIGAGSLVLAV
ncbi:MAG: DNA-binding domain-containing protein [Sphingomonadaceae bacterium]|nr:DNA-binding domain-containing protein [Sphingomonadaceae bacterium]